MPSVYVRILNQLTELESQVQQLTCCPEAVAKTPEGTADATGVVGEIAFDNNYFYIKTAVGWKRISLSTF